MYIVEDSSRLDHFLKEKTGFSGKKIKRSIDRGGVRVNGIVEKFANTRVKKNDQVSFQLIEEMKGGSLEVLYEDERMQIVNKPAGYVCEGGVHRLDKYTTGCLVVAKGDPEPLIEEFRQRRVEKTYLALVDGELTGSGVVENRLGPIGSFSGQKIMGETESGKTAITQWKALQSGPTASLIECRPVTGRTHQIRVHLASLGHPLIADPQYGRHVASHDLPHYLLHASSLKIFDIEVKAALSTQFRHAVRILLPV